MERRTVRYQAPDNDHWIINQLFGIINLEQRLSRAISQSDGPVDESVERQVRELKAWVARFDQALDRDFAAC